MTRLLASAVLAAALGALAPTAQGATAAGQVFARAAPSVFSIAVVGLDGELRTGSGVAVAPGRIVTNFHVVQGARKITVRRGEQGAEAILETRSEPHDLALLRVSGLDAPVAVFGSGSGVSIGQPVFAIGSPRGLELSLSEGIVSSLRKTDDGSLIQTTAPISPGSSGGGLFDEYGRLVGLTTAQIVNGQNLNFAVPVEWLRHVGIALRVAEIQGPEDTSAVAAAEVAPALEPAASGVTDALSPQPQPQPARQPRSSGRVYFGFAMIVALLLLTKPAIHWLTELLSRDPEPSAAQIAAALRAARPDRLLPFRAQARDELRNGRPDADSWRLALEQAGGDESRATATYIERRAQRLYRTDLDQKWAAAQAQSHGDTPRQPG